MLCRRCKFNNGFRKGLCGEEGVKLKLVIVRVCGVESETDDNKNYVIRHKDGKRVRKMEWENVEIMWSRLFPFSFVCLP